VKLVDEGEQRVATAAESNLDYVDPTPSARARPGDLAFRSMPAHAQTRYASGLEKMSMVRHPRDLRRGRQERWGRALNEWVKFGEYEFPAHNDPKQKIRIDDSTNMERYKKLSDNAQYWTSPLVGPDELPLLERPVRRREDEHRRSGTPALLRGDARLQNVRLSRRPSRSSAKGSPSGTTS